MKKRVLQIGFQKDIRSTSGWGAVERIIQSYDRALRDKCDTSFVTSDSHSICSVIPRFNPDVIICHNEFVANKVLAIARDVNPRCSVRLVSHYAYLKEAFGVVPYSRCFSLRERGLILKAKALSYKFRLNITRFLRDGGHFIAIDPRLCRALSGHGMVSYCHNYLYHSTPLTDAQDPLFRYICVGKIEARKRQFYLQKISTAIDYYGPIADKHFSLNHDYKGQLNNTDLVRTMSRYAALVLPSLGELHALVTIEALFAGVPLILSRSSAWVYASTDGCIFLDDNFKDLPCIQQCYTLDRERVSASAIGKFSLNLNKNREILFNALLG